MNDLIDKQTVADFIGIKVSTLANWRHRGVGPSYIKVKGVVMYERESIGYWVESLICFRDKEALRKLNWAEGQEPRWLGQRLIKPGDSSYKSLAADKKS